MKSQNTAANAHNLSNSIDRSGVSEEKAKSAPTLDEIHRRAFEIHNERGGHAGDMDGYLEAWLQADRELREKYNEGNDKGATKK